MFSPPATSQDDNTRRGRGRIDGSYNGRRSVEDMIAESALRSGQDTGTSGYRSHDAAAGVTVPAVVARTARRLPQGRRREKEGRREGSPRELCEKATRG